MWIHTYARFCCSGSYWYSIGNLWIWCIDTWYGALLYLWNNSTWNVICMCSKDYKITIIEHEILNLWNLEMISLHLMFSWRQLLTFDSPTYVINPIPTFSSVHCECIITFHHTSSLAGETERAHRWTNTLHSMMGLKPPATLSIPIQWMAGLIVWLGISTSLAVLLKFQGFSSVIFILSLSKFYSFHVCLW